MDLRHVEVTDEVRDETGGVPGRSRSELAFLDQDGVGTPSFVGQEGQQADAHGTATDDHDTGFVPHN